MYNTLTYTVRVETTPDQSKTLSDTSYARTVPPGRDKPRRSSSR